MKLSELAGRDVLIAAAIESALLIVVIWRRVLS
jgi:hypothetical protein